MTRHLMKRFGLACFILLWSAFITFAFIAILPGDYYTKFKISIAFAGLPVEETHHEILVQEKLDRPWLVQFGSWIWGLLSRGSLGHTLSLPHLTEQRVNLTFSYLLRPNGEIMNSLLICGTSMLVAWLLAIPMGILTSLRRGRWLYLGLSAVGMPSLAMPGYISAGLLLWLLSAKIDPMLSRASLWGICGWRYEGLPMSWAKFGSCLAHLSPIWIIVGLPVLTVATRVFRASIQDVLGQSFITTAHSKGLSWMKVYFKHALRNALNPLISTIGYTLPTVLVNALLVGFVFGIPTYGSLLKASVERQDPALLATMMLFYSAVLVFGNLAADFGLALVDPRIRYD